MCVCVCSNASLGEQRKLLQSQLSSCQEQVSALQAELKLYRKLLRDSGKAGGGALSSGRLSEVLEEVQGLQNQLRQGVRNADALSRQLASKLEFQHTQREEEEEVDGEEENEATPRTDQKRQMPTTSSAATRDNSAHFAGSACLVSASAPEAKIPLGALGTLTVRADVKMTSDGSTSSLPQLSVTGRAPHRDEPSLTLPAPRGHSSPFVKGAGLRESSHAHPSSGQTAPRCGKEAGESAKLSFSDYLTREGIPKLEPTLHHSHLPSTTRTGAEREEERGGAGPQLSSSVTHPLPHQRSSPPPSLSATDRGRRRQFESFESRLKEALESSSLQVRHSTPFGW